MGLALQQNAVAATLWASIAWVPIAAVVSVVYRFYYLYGPHIMCERKDDERGLRALVAPSCGVDRRRVQDLRFWKAWVRWHGFPFPEFGWEDFLVWNHYLCSAGAYFEWGMGGSTSYAVVAYPSLKRMHAVETSADWVASVRKQPEVADMVSAGRLHLHYLDVGPLEQWGYGKPIQNESMRLRIATVSQAILLATREGLGEWDVILVDGAYRVGSFLQSMAVLGGSGHGTGTVVMYHDYYWHRDMHEHVRIIEDFADIVACGGWMVAFRRKAQVDEAALAQAITLYATVYP